MSETIDNWKLLNLRKYEREYMRPLFKFTLDFFIGIFGRDIMSREQCIVFNDPSEDYPMLIRNKLPIMIRTNAVSLRHWSQFMFHLSHELSHYAIRQQKSNKDAIIKWFEETVCEALSMYVLLLAATRWSDCPLFLNDNNYGHSLKKYFDNLYNETDESVLRKCGSYLELQQIERTCEDNRQGRSMDRNYSVCGYEEFAN